VLEVNLTFFMCQLRHLEKAVLGKIPAQSIERKLSVCKGFYPGIACPEHHAGIQVITKSCPEQALLPVDDDVITPPLVFPVQAEFVIDPECAENIVPANVAPGVDTIVLGFNRP
jgi:hypothetical protein